MSIVNKAGVNPVGTEHHTSKSFIGSKLEGAGDIYYTVHSLTGVNTWVDDPVVWLKLNRETQHDAPMLLPVPLSLFVRLFEPTSEADVFWESAIPSSNN